jgi:hypothetical protein
MLGMIVMGAELGHAEKNPIHLVSGCVLGRLLLTGLFAGIVLSHQSKGREWGRAAARPALRPKTGDG